MTSHRDANYFIQGLGLIPHPEGGFYRQSYRSPEVVESVRADGPRRLSTSIYFLLTRDTVSHLHRLKSDEIWYYHDGWPLTIYVIDENGKLEQFVLGLDLERGELPQITVPKGSIFGSALNLSKGACGDKTADDSLCETSPTEYALVGCMVSPGFEFADFELFTRQELLQRYPEHQETILKLTPHSDG